MYLQERVQVRFSRILPGLEGLSYKEWLNRLGLFSTEHRRLKGDLIHIFKITRGIWLQSFSQGRGILKLEDID